MAEKAHHSIPYDNWTLVVDEKELRRLCEEIGNALDHSGARSVTNFSFTACLSDKSSFTTSNLEEVLNEENDRKRSLTSLQIVAERGLNWITLNLGVVKEKPSNWPNASTEEKSNELIIEGEDRKWVYVTASSLEEQIRRMKQWYPRSGVWVTVAVVVAFWLMGKASDFLTQKYGNSDLIGLGSLVAIGIVGFGTSRLFPNLIFSIGDGSRRYKMLQTIRSQLFWAVLVSLLVSVAGAFFYDLIKSLK